MPRLGVGMPIIAGVSQEAVTAIDDFFFESHTSGEVTPINTATRSNLFTYSHDFSQSSWTKADSAVSTSAVKNPFGETATAANGPYKLVTSSASNQVYIRETLTTVVGKYYTFSVFAQKAEYDYIALVGLNPTTIHYFNLANGTTASAHSIQPVIEDAGNGWYRCSVTLVADTTSKFFGIYLAGDSGNISLGSVADDNGIYIYGAQVEQNSPVSALITSSGEAGTATTALSDTSEVWDFDSTDIMLEADPEDEGFWEEGSNLVTNHDYDELSDNFVEVPGFETTYNANQWLAFSSPSTLEISTEQAHEGSSSLKIAGTDGKGVQASATQFLSDYSVNDVVEITAYVYPTISPDNRIKTGVNNSDRSITTLFTGLTLNQWNKIQYQVTISTASNNYISFLNSGTGEFYLDNVSARIVDPNNRWSLTNTTIENGALTFVDNTSAAQFALHSNSSMMDVGGAYEITLNVNRTSGSFRVLSGTGGSALTPAVSINSSGVQTFRVTNNTSGGKLFLYTDTGENFIGTIDNITVREYAIQPQDV